MRDYFARPILTLDDATALIRVVDLFMEDPVFRSMITGEQAHSIVRLRNHLHTRVAFHEFKLELDDKPHSD